MSKYGVISHFSCSENDYLIVAFHRFTISIWFYRAEHNGGVKRGNGSQESDQFKHLSKKIQEVTLDVVITKKNGKKYVRLQLSIPWAQRSFWDKVTPDIEDFTDEPEVQVVKNTFGDNSKKW